MSYVLYNTLTESFGRATAQPYTMDGQPGPLPEGTVELQIIREEYPADIPDGFVAAPVKTVDLEAGQLVYSFEIVEAPADPIAAGYLVEPEDFILALGDADRMAFTAMLTLIQEALSLEAITNETPQTIADKTGAPHTVSTLRLRQILVGYGFHYKALWDAARASAS